MSKLPILLALFLLISLTSFSQNKIKLSAFAGKGFSSFVGRGTTERSNYYRNGLSFPNALDSIGNHYGRNLRDNFFAGLQIDFPVSENWVILFSSQYERTGSRLTGDTVFTPSVNYQANGKFDSYYDFISINPQIGRRFIEKNIAITPHIGIDYTSKLDRGERFDFTDQNGQNNSIGGSGGEPEVNDFRITLGAMLTHKRWGIDLNYKHGLTNYNKYSSEKVFMRLLHLRLMYSFLGKKI